MIPPLTLCRLSTILMAANVASCGAYVPAKTVYEENKTYYLSNGDPAVSRNGSIESNIVANIRCEIRVGVWRALQFKTVPWLSKWGTKVTLTLTWDEMSNISPGLIFTELFPNNGSFSLGLGASTNAHATREEKITFTLDHEELLREQNERIAAGYAPTCRRFADGTQIQSDLQIDQFIFDKAGIAEVGEPNTKKSKTYPVFSTFQETITFVWSLGGNVTPTWKFTRFSANTGGTFLGGSRSTTSIALLTLGPLESKGTVNDSPKLVPDAQVLHDATYGANATASSIISQTR